MDPRLDTTSTDAERSPETGTGHECREMALLSAILGSFPTPYLIIGPDMLVTRMNQQMERLTGYTAAEAIGRMTCAELLSTPRCNTPECFFKQAVASARPVTGVSSTVIDREGRTIPVLVSASAVFDPDGRLLGGFETFSDAGALLEAEQKIEILTELSQEGILLIDDSRTVIFANSKMGEILGHSRQELIGMDLADILPVQHQKMVTDLLKDQEYPRQLRSCTTIQPLSETQQDYSAYETCVAVSRIGNRIIVCMFFMNLTGRVEIERRIRRTNSFLNNIIRSSVDGIVVVDPKGQVIIFNEGAENILGYKAEEIIGHPDGFGKLCDPALARENMRRMRSGEYGPPGKLMNTQINVKRSDGEEVPVNFSAAIIMEAGREVGSVGIFSDLRERIGMRRELEQARVQLLQAEKIASLGRLAAGVAHEINNPLAGILIYADMLMAELKNTPQWAQDLQEIINQTLRCKQIVTRLLEFSRQSKGQMLPTNVTNIIGRSVDLLSHQALFHDIKFKVELPPGLPDIRGDSGQLQQVFTNLIINAADAMDGVGKLTITGTLDEENRQIVLKFADTGRGLPPEIMDKLFEPFFTTKAQGQGTGLGLSVAYGILKQHGGRIEAGNSPEGGAVFTVTLPVLSQDGEDDTVEG